MRAPFALLGAGFGVGVLILAAGLRPQPRSDARFRHVRGEVSAVRVAGVLTAAAVVGAATRWPVGAVLAGVAAWNLPKVLSPDRAHRRALDRVEAIAAWAEDLSGTLRSAAGIEQALIKTAETAPVEIRPQLETLSATLRAGTRLAPALRALAADLEDPTADMVVNVLLLAAQYEARDIATGLSGVGRQARRKASARMRIATGRVRIRTATRIVITVILATVVLLLVFADDIVVPYSTAVGQLILAVLGVAFGGALAWMMRTSRVPDLPRILTNPDEAAP